MSYYDICQSKTIHLRMRKRTRRGYCIWFVSQDHCYGMVGTPAIDLRIMNDRIAFVWNMRGGRLPKATQVWVIPPPAVVVHLRDRVSYRVHARRRTWQLDNLNSRTNSWREFGTLVSSNREQQVRLDIIVLQEMVTSMETCTSYNRRICMYQAFYTLS